MAQLGTRADNEQGTYKLVTDGLEQKVAQRVDDPQTQSKLDDVISALGGSSNSTTTAGTPYGVVVSTSAVILAASNTDRLSIVITNNGTGDLYIGHDATVTTSGPTMGLKVTSGGVYTDSGSGLYLGDLYGIYSSSSATETVSVSERTP